jgi:hypothetical protein
MGSRSPGDEIGPYTDTQLRKMDDAFVAAVTVAFATGKESPQVACATRLSKSRRAVPLGADAGG